MKILICTFFGQFTPHIETDLEIIQNHLDQGDSVTVVECRSELVACDINYPHDVGICSLCRSKRSKGFAELSGNIRLLPLLRLTQNNKAELQQMPSSFNTIEELQKFKIENLDLGYGVLSSIISMFRNPKPDLKKLSNIVRTLALSSLSVYRSIQNILDAGSYDRVYFYNGRYAPLRAVLRACQSRNVPFFTHERGCNLKHYALYENSLPHELTYVEKRIRDSWARAENDPDREKTATRFYDQRARGIIQSWHSFVKDQQADLLPEGWDPTRKNIVLFSTSQDEFVAIGDVWRNPIYGSQNEGIERIIASMKDLPEEFHLYLRIHPNQRYSRDELVEKLSGVSLPRVTVIFPADKISSYALLQHADKVVSFGSSMGIEATFLGKPSILAGICFYRNLDATYNPQSHEQVMNLIQADIPPKSRESALIYGFYMTTFGIPFRYFEASGIMEGTFRGKSLDARLWVRTMDRMLNRFPLARTALNKWTLWAAYRRLDVRPPKTNRK